MLTIGRTSQGHRPFKLPIDLVTQTVAILANKGRGKTYTAMVMTEEMLAAGAQVVALDPTGVWWGLQADGAGPGLPILIMGGEHGNVPLEPTSGEIVADFVVDSGQSCILDLSAFESNGAQDRFVTAFAERIYRRKAARRSPVHLMLDEADSFAPQRPARGQERMLGAFEAIVRRGRSRGLGITMITQRPAVLNKNVLMLIELLVCLGITGPLDQDAVAEWVKRHDAARAKEFVASLASLPKGTAWLWSPEWLNVFEQVQIRTRRTFDSSRTPEAGATPAAPKKLAQVDLAKLSQQIQASIERAKADDPKALRQQIRELQRQLAERPAAEVREVQVSVLTEDDRVLLRQADEACRNVRCVMDELGEVLLQVVSKIAGIVSRNGLVVSPNSRTSPPGGGDRPVHRAAPTPRPAHVPARAAPPRSPAGQNGQSLAKAERLILTALAQHGASAKRSLAAWAGYAINGGGFNNALGRCRSAGWIETNVAGGLAITEAGHQALGEYEPLPEGKALLDYWLGQVGKAEREILTALFQAYPTALTKDQIAEATESGYAANGGGFGNALGRLRSLELIEGHGQIKLCEELVG